MGQKMVVAISNSCYVVYCFLLDPISNFIKIGWKTQKLKIFYIGRFWLVGLVGRKMLVGISNSFYVVFGPILVPIPNFIKIGRKTQKLKIFTKGSQCPMPVCMREIGSRIRILFRGLTITSVQNLNKIGWKLAELAHREIFSQKLEIVRGADWTNTKIEK